MTSLPSRCSTTSARRPPCPLPRQYTSAEGTRPMTTRARSSSQMRSPNAWLYTRSPSATSTSSRYQRSAMDAPTLARLRGAAIVVVEGRVALHQTEPRIGRGHLKHLVVEPLGEPVLVVSDEAAREARVHERMQGGLVEGFVATNGRRDVVD